MKKIFFIHVAKTAGSSFNRFLKNNFVGEEHCERFLDQNLAISNLEYLQSLDYISGHLPLRVFFQNKLSLDDYFIMTFLREPNSQLLSHLNWMIHIYDVNPEFFSEHPDNIQNLCLYLREQDWHNPNTLIRVLTELEDLLSNSQSRYFVKQTQKKPNSFSSSEIIHELLLLDLVGITERYRESLDLFVHTTRREASVQIYRENQNDRYRLTKDILENDSIQNFLYEYNRVDHEVYAFFNWRFQAASQILAMIKSRKNPQSNSPTVF